jgi:gamma-glutamylcyclotransferase (GGCT)/AIG2-like uncharacterized protein YtfP
VEIDVFVYGTLRPGGCFHERYCAGVAAIEPAIVRGRIAHLPAGYPMLSVPRARVLARGSSDPARDALLQHEWRGRIDAHPGDAEGEAVEGDILRFDDPERRLPRLDALENFRAEGGGLYDRVLVRVTATRTGRVVLAWVYVAPISAA